MTRRVAPLTQNNQSGLPELLQGEHDQRLVVVIVAAADGDASTLRNGDVLLAVLAQKSHGDRTGAVVETGHPQLPAGLGVEGTEAVIVGGSYEDQASGGDD